MSDSSRTTALGGLILRLTKVQSSQRRLGSLLGRNGHVVMMSPAPGAEFGGPMPVSFPLRRAFQ